MKGKLLQAPFRKKAPPILNPFITQDLQNTRHNLDGNSPQIEAFPSVQKRLPCCSNSWDSILYSAERHLNEASASGLLNSPGGFLSEAGKEFIDGRSEKEYFASIFFKLKATIGNEGHPLLNTVNSYYLQAGGKRVRPLMILLLSLSYFKQNSSAAPWTSFQKLAQISELMHTASLMHDDVIDNAHSRRSLLSAPFLFGNKAAILSGDYLLASAAILLARLNSLHIFDLMCQIICDLARGELMQMDVPPNEKFSLDYYLEKSYRKTACLMAKSFQSASILAGQSEQLQKASFEFGKNFGIAFQIVDDILDYQVSSQDFGKTTAKDLIDGHLTAPFLYAIQEDPTLARLYDSEFANHGEIDLAFEIITKRTKAIEKAKFLAKEYQERALAQLELIKKSLTPADDSINFLVELTKTLTNRRR
ncbi:coq1 putative hexaprenyl diphosphate synthase [Mitosporidium daphniae]